MAIKVQAQVTGLEKNVQDVVNRINRRGGLNLKINERSFAQPLGRITTKANEFTKSLEASNARVIAFGASVGIINGVKDAFENLITSVVKVEKALQDVNVVLNASAPDLRKFGDGIFKIAKNTAQSFDAVSEAATEFARQGLSIEETLKRTNDALILTRLTGMNAADSVKNLTAAMNTFSKAGLTSTQIISKMASVDVEFAVSADDLAAAISRTGQAAISAGVDIDQLIGLVTAAQQKTARGGAVIGNSFKTIFTRIRRPDTLKQLEQLGIAVRDVEYNTLPAIQILSNLAKTYDTLSDAQKSQIGQTVAGVFQINILKAALADASQQNSILSRATQISSTATDEAIKKNEKLNETLAALASRTSISLLELSKSIGEISLGPGIKSVLNFINGLADGLTKLTKGDDVGSKFFQTFLAGIGKIATGPGMVVFVGIVVKLFANAAKFATQSIKDILGITSKAQQLKGIEESIVGVLGRNSVIQAELLKLEGNRAAQEKVVLELIKQQTNAMAAQQQIARQVAPGLAKAGVRTDLSLGGRGRSAGGPVKKYAGGGHVPNFANTMGGLRRSTQSQFYSNISSKGAPNLNPKTSSGARRDIIKYGKGEGLAYQKGGKFQQQRESKGVIDARSSGMWMLLPDFQGPRNIMSSTKGPVNVADPDLKKEFARKKPKVMFNATGLNPRAMKGLSPGQKTTGMNLQKTIASRAGRATAAWINKLGPSNAQKKVSGQDIAAKLENDTNKGAKGALGAITGASFEAGMNDAFGYKAASRESAGDFDVRGGKNIDKLSSVFQIPKGQGIDLADYKNALSLGNNQSMAAKILRELGASTTGTLGGKAIRGLHFAPEKDGKRTNSADSRSSDFRLRSLSKSKFNKGGSVPNFAELASELNLKAFGGTSPIKFDKNLRPYIKQTRGGTLDIFKRDNPNIKLNQASFNKDMHYIQGSSLTPELKERINNLYYSTGKMQTVGLSSAQSNRNYQHRKMGKMSTGGMVPNFSPLGDAISREMAAGVPGGAIRVGANASLVSSMNPAGLGVFNTIDEPAGLSQGINRSISEGRNPATYGVPNFAPTVTHSDFKTPVKGLGDRLSNQYNAELQKRINLFKQGKISLDTLHRHQRTLATKLHMTDSAYDRNTKEVNKSLGGWTKLKASLARTNNALGKTAVGAKMGFGAAGRSPNAGNFMMSGKGMGLMMGAPMLAAGIERALIPGGKITSQNIGTASAAKGAGGALSGATTGAIIGSMFPGAGTAIGAIVGGLGGMAMGIMSAGKSAKEFAEAVAQAKTQMEMSAIGKEFNEQWAKLGLAQKITVKQAESLTGFFDASNVTSGSAFQNNVTKEEVRLRNAASNKEFQKRKARGGIWGLNEEDKIFNRGLAIQVGKEFGTTPNWAKGGMTMFNGGSFSDAPGLAPIGFTKAAERNVGRKMPKTASDYFQGIELLKTMGLDATKTRNFSFTDENKVRQTETTSLEKLQNELGALRNLSPSRRSNSQKKRFTEIQNLLSTMLGDDFTKRQKDVQLQAKLFGDTLITIASLQSAAFTESQANLQRASELNLSRLKRQNDSKILQLNKTATIESTAGIAALNIEDEYQTALLKINSEKQKKAAQALQKLMSGTGSSKGIFSDKFIASQGFKDQVETLRGQGMDSSAIMSQLTSAGQIGKFKEQNVFKTPQSINLLKEEGRLNKQLEGEAKRQSTNAENIRSENLKTLTATTSINQIKRSTEIAEKVLLGQVNLQAKAQTQNLQVETEMLTSRLGLQSKLINMFSGATRMEALQRSAIDKMQIFDKTADDTLKNLETSQAQSLLQAAQGLTSVTGYQAFVANIKSIQANTEKGVPLSREQIANALRQTNLSAKAQQTLEGILVLQEEGKRVESQGLAAKRARVQAEIKNAQILEAQSQTIDAGRGEAMKTIREDISGMGKQFGHDTTSSFLNNLESGLNNVATGATKARHAFLQFAGGIVSDMQQLMSKNISRRLTSAIFGSGWMQTAQDRIGSLFAPGKKGGGVVQKYNKGGQVPSLVQGGEYLFSREAVGRLGVNNLSSLNSMSVPKFASGGIADSKQLSSRLLANPDPEMASIYGLRKQKKQQDADYAAAIKAWKKRRLQATIGTAAQFFLSSALSAAAVGSNGVGRTMKTYSGGAGPSAADTITPGASQGSAVWSTPMRPGNARGGMIRGGSGTKDDIPAVLQGGEFVMRKAAVQKYGTSLMDKLNKGMNEGGSVGNSLNPTTNPSSSGGTNVAINITLNGSDGAETSSSDESGASKDSKELANKIKSVVLGVIRDEQRVGGSLQKKNPEQ